MDHAPLRARGDRNLSRVHLDVDPILDLARRPVLRGALVKRGDEGRGRRWRQTSTYRFAALDVNVRVKVEVFVKVDVHARIDAICDESTDLVVDPKRRG